MEFSAVIPEIEKRIGYTFRDKSLLRQAFTRASYCNENGTRGEGGYQSNEVLEFFGDGVLSCAVISLLVKRSSERYAHGIKTALTEGDFSNIKSRLSDKKNLSRSIAKLGLQEFLLLGVGDERQGVRDEPSVMEDLFESILGAVYIDCEMDMQAVLSVVERMLDVSVFLEKSVEVLKSAKNALQEFCADKRHRLPAPKYLTKSRTGPDHAQIYERAVYIGEREVATGFGKNISIADTEAASLALEILTKEHRAACEVKDGRRHPADSYASRLFEYATRRHLTPPDLSNIAEAKDSTPQSPVFVCTVTFESHTVTAIGASKTAAKQAAAKELLALLNG